MYRLLIADDEESIREGVADFVRQNCPEWDVAALARDGREALALAREILPDAVLTDITMPHMNGLEFLESLSDLLPEAKLLVLSGYDQFEYAVQALRLGVSDYLLKPLDTAKLVSALSRFAAELDAQALRWAQIETLRTNTQKTNELELQSYFRAALLGEELPALSAANAVFAQEGTSYCCVLCDGLDAQRALLERVLEQRLYGAVRTVLLRLGTPPRQAVVFCAPRTARAGLFLTLSHALTSIAVSCKRAQALDVHFFVGCIAETPAKLELSYRQSTQARAYAFPEQAAPLPPTRMFWPESFCRVRSRRRSSFVTSPPRYSAGSRAAFVQNCEALFAWFVEREIRDATFIRMCVLRLCYSILKKPASDMPMSYYEFTNFQQEIMAAASMEELRACFENFVSLYWLRRQGEKPPRRILTERVSEVVQAHISDIDFSLDDVAAALFISPNYLRQLFKQETGQTFTEFLTAQRMQHAHMLLGNPQTKVCDVAEQAGYADSRDFSVCLKNSTYDAQWNIKLPPWRERLDIR